MPSATPTTDERLRSHLDANQLARERLAVDLLAADRRFSGVKPRHPRGGPDGGVDIDATFEAQTATAAAVGFVNGATDSEDDKKQIKAKYKADARSAATRTPRPGMFVFFTNVNLTRGEKSALQTDCAAAGIAASEIFDRERMRVLLDSPDGLGIRYRYLQIPLSDAEQAAFFSRWGDDIQRIVGSRFSSVESSLARIQFLYEAASPLDDFTVTAELDREYSAVEIGHFRLVCSLHLEEPKSDIFGVSFGSTDNPGRHDAKGPADLVPTAGGIGRNMCGGAWIIGELKGEKAKIAKARKHKKRSDSKLPRWKLGSFTSIGREKVHLLPISFGFGGGLMRLPPYLSLRDMDGCSFVLFANRSLAEKIKIIHVSGNEYKLAEFTGKRIQFDKPNAPPYFPYTFSNQELSDPWVRIMGGIGPFRLSFSEFTPQRMYEPELVMDSMYEARKKRLDEYKKRMEE
jgi:hypothetical protein